MGAALKRIANIYRTRVAIIAGAGLCEVGAVSRGIQTGVGRTGKTIIAIQQNGLIDAAVYNITTVRRAGLAIITEAAVSGVLAVTYRVADVGCATESISAGSIIRSKDTALCGIACIKGTVHTIATVAIRWNE